MRLNDPLVIFLSLFIRRVIGILAMTHPETPVSGEINLRGNDVSLDNTIVEGYPILEGIRTGDNFTVLFCI